MTKINIRKQSAIQLDIEKRKLEASIIVDLQRIFRNMANDAANLYNATGNLPSAQLSKNYSSEFLKAIRDAMRKSIKKFGFNLRKTVEKKHGLFFDAETKAMWIDLELKQTIRIQDDDIDDKLEDINNNFFLASTLFIANESENQNEFVEQTNNNMLNAALLAGITAFSNLVGGLQDEVANLSNSLIDASPSQRTKINRQIASVRRQIDRSTANQQAIVAENIRVNLLSKAPARSELIAAQNVGLAESWARQTEAELVDDANLITANSETLRVVKSWSTILDDRTRSSHVRADGQQVPIDQQYNVGGESLLAPRLGAIPANNINCRCASVHETVTAAGSLPINNNEPVVVPVSRPKKPTPKPIKPKPAPTPKPIKPKPAPTPKPIKVLPNTGPSKIDQKIKATDFKKVKNLTSTERAYLETYSGDGFLELNDYLRDPLKYADSPSKIASLNKFKDGVQSSILKVKTTKPLTVYRGVNNKQFTDLVSKGDIKSLDALGFQSTSAKTGLASSWSGPDGVLMKINVKKGTSALPLSSISRNAAEAEILLPQGGKYVVKKVYKQEVVQGIDKTIMEVDFVE
jgi:hypothetical protein